MAVSITVNGVPVADGSTIHLTGDPTKSTKACVVMDFPLAQGSYQAKLTLWDGSSVNMPNPVSIHQVDGEHQVCMSQWDNAVANQPITGDATWFEANGTMDHQIKTIHVVFD